MNILHFCESVARATLSAMLASAMAIVFGTSLAFIGASAHAAVEEQPSVVVHFADLDISHPEGATALYRRIQSAAFQVCSEYNASGMWYVSAARECARRAIAEAVAKLNLPTLNAVYASATHQPQASRLAGVR
jgi:UrcA family protein